MGCLIEGDAGEVQGLRRHVAEEAVAVGQGAIGPPGGVDLDGAPVGEGPQAGVWVEDEGFVGSEGAYGDLGGLVAGAGEAGCWSSGWARTRSPMRSASMVTSPAGGVTGGPASKENREQRGPEPPGPFPPRPLGRRPVAPQPPTLSASRAAVDPGDQPPADAAGDVDATLAVEDGLAEGHHAVVEHVAGVEVEGTRARVTGSYWSSVSVLLVYQCWPDASVVQPPTSSSPPTVDAARALNAWLSSAASGPRNDVESEALPQLDDGDRAEAMAQLAEGGRVGPLAIAMAEVGLVDTAVAFLGRQDMNDAERSYFVGRCLLHDPLGRQHGEGFDQPAAVEALQAAVDGGIDAARPLLADALLWGRTGLLLGADAPIDRALVVFQDLASRASHTDAHANLQAANLLVRLGRGRRRGRGRRSTAWAPMP